jgi:hypothetical protein
MFSKPGVKRSKAFKSKVYFTFPMLDFNTNPTSLFTTCNHMWLLLPARTTVPQILFERFKGDSPW